ncbi:MipA/OmpV family protein [Mangrovibrevibacter kandeliae]|uniref:MipA/OmpV family protein n=1 Tax=Mangrovibrevibacter kandeliae TaxID=2968473 RepID=UPI002119196A|nr:MULTISPECIES: MipA/OmpV family protein [unclassified Aurantimonas]MCQ8783653.1 MipA/OmpV family protein [Aurantimonas sp. CSK15Z-1]MCW4116384.1 MipA/OmpV family protein [Aurantimonas sp. MSK8Z-1]
MHRSALHTLVLSGALLASFAAHAADVKDSQETAAMSPDNRIKAVFELGAAGRVAPEYYGSGDYEFSAVPLISFEYLYIPGVLEVGESDGRGGGFSIGPSFGYTGKRDSSDHDDLDGLDDVDATYEAGIKLGYEWSYADVYGAVRYAFGGADGFVGEVGADAIARPTDTLELKLGPKVSFASSNYLGAYLGVSAAEAARSGGRFSAYDPDGGISSVGAVASARWEFYPTYYLNAEATYDRLVGDAADSPVVDAGSKDQYSFQLGVSKKFSVGF